jgi:hypothetical protein
MSDVEMKSKKSKKSKVEEVDTVEEVSIFKGHYFSATVSFHSFLAVKYDCKFP